MIDLKYAVNQALAQKRKTRSWLAVRLGLGYSTLAERLRSKNPSSKTITEISEALDMKPSELVALSETEESGQ